MSATLVALAATAEIGPWGPGPWPGPWAAGFGWVFLLVPLFWMALVVFLIVFFAVRRRRHGWVGPGPGPGPGPFGRAPFLPPGASAERTLAERFARGDIDETEYRARLGVLRADRPEY